MVLAAEAPKAAPVMAPPAKLSEAAVIALEYLRNDAAALQEKMRAVEAKYQAVLTADCKRAGLELAECNIGPDYVITAKPVAPAAAVKK